MVATINEPARTGGFLVSEANGYRSRGQGLLASGQVLAPGTVLGRVTHGAVTVAALAGNHGNGSIGAVSLGAGVSAGVYRAVCIGAVAGGGRFLITAPGGPVLGVAVVGTAFSGGGLGLTVAAGGTDFAGGDSFTLTVAAGSGQLRRWHPDAVDGSEVAAAVLWAPADTSDGERRVTIIERDAELNGQRLAWADDASADDRAAGVRQLAALGLIVRE